jgi:predicted dithiol-disulfide oxidoreductase (DUF899 family)
MADSAEPKALADAKTLAHASPIRFPNESAEYRRAREALLAEEIELRRHIERVAAQRRALPPGGEVTGDYRFIGSDGEVTFEDLFGDKDTLIVYSFMFGPQRSAACPMCTNAVGTWNATIPDIQQRAAFAVVARSPIERLTAYSQERGWRHVPWYSDVDQAYSRDYHAIAPDGGDSASYDVFTRRDGVIRHFWSGEMGPQTTDPGQDGRGAPDLSPLWTILDTTPEGRGADWYPKLNYP